jgi:hypothetical protein
MINHVRTKSLDTRLVSAGPISAAAVVLGGFTLGFFAWYALIAHVAGLRVINEEMLVLSVAGGISGAVALWRHYSRRQAARSTLALADVMRWDAASWGALCLFWLGFSSRLGAEWSGRAIALGIGLFFLVKVIAAARSDHAVREVLATFVVTRIPLLVIAELAAVIIGQRVGAHVAVSQNPFLNVWGRWDAVHYVDIATRGYYGTDLAFFPLYPALLALLGPFTGNHVVAGLLISNIAFFLGLFYLYKLVEELYDRGVAHRAIFYISIFPTAIFFSAVYTESLFFALTVAAFYYMRRDRWLTAGCIGFLAALTRVEGMLLIAPMLLESMHRLKQPADFFKRGFAVIATGAGLICFMAYLWVLHGDPLYFSHVQINWDRKLAPPWASIGHTFHLIRTAHQSTLIANQCLELAFTIFMIVMLCAGFRVMRRSFAAYTALSILVPMSTSSLMSMPRFALVLFPLFIVLAVWGRRPTVNNAIVSFSLLLLGLFTVFFADWYWVA